MYMSSAETDEPERAAAPESTQEAVSQTTEGTQTAAELEGEGGSSKVGGGEEPQSPEPLSLPRASVSMVSEFLTGRALFQVRNEFFFEGRQDVTQNVRDNWILLLTDHEIRLTVRWVAHQINKQFAGQKIVLAGILKGVFVFMKDLCTHLTIPYSVYFLEASSYHGQEQADSVIFSSKINKAKFEGRKIVLLDELFDNGKTLYEVSKALQSELGCPASNIFTCVLFSKKKTPKYPPPDLVGFDQFPDVWLVGYGLDDDGEKRGWPHIFGVPKPPGMPRGPDDVIFDKNPQAETAFYEVRKKFRYKLTEVAATF